VIEVILLIIEHTDKIRYHDRNCSLSFACSLLNNSKIVDIVSYRFE